LWVDAWAILEHQLGIVDGLDLDLPGAHVGDRLVTRHEAPSSSRGSAAPAGRDGRDARRAGAVPTPETWGFSGALLVDTLHGASLPRIQTAPAASRCQGASRC